MKKKLISLICIVSIFALLFQGCMWQLTLAYYRFEFDGMPIYEDSDNYQNYLNSYLDDEQYAYLRVRDVVVTPYIRVEEYTNYEGTEGTYAVFFDEFTGDENRQVTVKRVVLTSEDGNKFDSGDISATISLEKNDEPMGYFGRKKVCLFSTSEFPLPKMARFKLECTVEMSDGESTTVKRITYNGWIKAYYSSTLPT